MPSPADFSSGQREVIEPPGTAIALARPLLPALIVFLSWVAVILLFALQLHFGNRLDWHTALSRSAFDRGPWALLSPFILLLVWWIHRSGFIAWRTVLWHIAGLFIALFAAEGLVQGVFLKFMFPQPVGRVAAERSDASMPPPPSGAEGVYGGPLAGYPPPKGDGGYKGGDYFKGPPPKREAGDYPPPKRDGGENPPPKRDGGDYPPPKRDDGGYADRQGPPTDYSSPKMGARPPRDMPGPVMPPPSRGGPPPDFSADTPPWMVFGAVALRKAYNGIPIYLVIAALAHAFFFWRHLRERERRVSELEARLTMARADVLRLQLEPHFLFNTLNSIGTLVYRDPKLADDLIVRLSTLLRRLLDLRDERTIPLRVELETLRAYVAIEQARFGERLNFEETIDPAALDFQVPVLLLQPLAENSVRHGIEPLGRPGTLAVRVDVRGRELHVMIEDDGVGMAAGSGKKHGFGLGLSSASVRLRALYGTGAQIESAVRMGGGTRIEIRIPRQPLPAAAAFTQTSERG